MSRSVVLAGYFGSNSVSAINTATGQVIATITVGSYPRSVASSATGANEGDVYVANNGPRTLSVISPSNTVITTISGVGEGLVAVSPINGDVYVTSGNDGHHSVSVISPSNVVITSIAVGANPFGVAVSPTGVNAGDVYIGNVNDNTVSVISPSNTVITTISGIGHGFVAVSPINGDVYVSGGSNTSPTVSVINPSTNTVISTIEVGRQPFGVEFNATGTQAYVTNSLDNTVSVINTANGTVVATITVGSYPYGVAVP